VTGCLIGKDGMGAEGGNADESSCNRTVTTPCLVMLLNRVSVSMSIPRMFQSDQSSTILSCPVEDEEPHSRSESLGESPVE